MPSEAYVWAWLPDQTSPVVAGLLSREGEQLVFNYGQSYLRRDEAISLYGPELPLQPGLQKPRPPLRMPSCLRDASPDAWGRRVIINRKFGLNGDRINVDSLDELTYLLESGSDRPGAVDFQTSPDEYLPRQAGSASLTELLEASARVEAGFPVTPELDQALFHGTSLGGARPKAQIEHPDRKLIAKFSSSADVQNIVKLEFLAMRLAAKAGLNVAEVQLTSAAGKDVILVRRFDRVLLANGWGRRAFVSALTILGLDEMEARYASYQDLAEIIRRDFSDPSATLRELFGRITFNVLCGNTDDHARNHAAFWDGKRLSLTPAYDICPQSRAGNEASQAMLIHEGDRRSRLASCLDAAAHFQLSAKDAEAIVQHQVGVIADEWIATCDEARLSTVERNAAWRRQFLNPYAFDGAPGAITGAWLGRG